MDSLQVRLASTTKEILRLKELYFKKSLSQKENFEVLLMHSNQVENRKNDLLDNGRSKSIIKITESYFKLLNISQTISKFIIFIINENEMLKGKINYINLSDKTKREQIESILSQTDNLIKEGLEFENDIARKSIIMNNLLCNNYKNLKMFYDCWVFLAPISNLS